MSNLSFAPAEQKRYGTLPRPSKESAWGDSEWCFAQVVPSIKNHPFVWSFGMPDGSRFTDKKWENLLYQFRAVVWCLLHRHPRQVGLKPSNLSTLAVSIRQLVRWMGPKKYRSFEELTQKTCRRYFEETVAYYQEKGKNPSHSQLYLAMHLLESIYLIREVLADFEVKSLPAAPFGYLSARNVVSQVAPRPRKKLEPVPESVTVELLNCSIRLLGAPADDAIKLADMLFESYSRAGSWLSKGYAAVIEDLRAKILAFRFSHASDEFHPWCGPISDPSTAIDKAFRVVSRIWDAALCFFQASVGLRSNEFGSLKCENSNSSEFPSCISIEPASSGLNELFIVTGTSVKTERTKRTVKWVIGLRPVGSSQIPPPVRALIVLRDLLRPWREQAKSKLLLFNPSLSRRTQSANANTLSARLKIYARETLSSCDSNHQSRDKHSRALIESDFVQLRPHRWRPTWAQFLFRVDPRLLPAISLHFKHISLAMTERGYVDGDIEQLQVLDEVSRDWTIRYFYECATGRRAPLGPLGKLVRDHRNWLKDKRRKRSKRGLMRRITMAVDEHELRIWSLEEGKCLMSLWPTEARCHKLGRTSHWSRKMPNFEVRSAAICAGCSCFSPDRDNTPFWILRYRSNRQAVEAALSRGEKAGFYVFEARYKQAEAILRRMEIEPDKLKL